MFLLVLAAKCSIDRKLLWNSSVDLPRPYPPGVAGRDGQRLAEGSCARNASSAIAASVASSKALPRIAKERLVGLDREKQLRELGGTGPAPGAPAGTTSREPPGSTRTWPVPMLRRYVARELAPLCAQLVVAEVTPGRVECDGADRDKEVDVSHRFRDDQRGHVVECQRFGVLEAGAGELEPAGDDDLIVTGDAVQSRVRPYGVVPQLGAHAEAGERANPDCGVRAAVDPDEKRRRRPASPLQQSAERPVLQQLAGEASREPRAALVGGSATGSCSMRSSFAAREQNLTCAPRLRRQEGARRYGGRRCRSATG